MREAKEIRWASFVDAMNAQIAHEFAASQQYVAVAVWYEGEALPQLAGYFYRQAVEERNHAMIIVKYLLDVRAPVTIPGVAAPRTDFDDPVAPVALALEQERRVTDQIKELASSPERRATSWASSSWPGS